MLLAVNVLAIAGGTANFARVSCLLFGGAVVGAGFIVLWNRAQFYRQAGLEDGYVAMLTLMVVNALIMTFVSLTLLNRWDTVLSWRALLAFAVFFGKAVFFKKLSNLGIEQERRLLAQQDVQHVLV